MCTLALYFQLFDGLPLLVAANRDEHYDRPSAEPAVVNTTPRILAGRDLRAGGTWLGVNAHGLLVGILNRRANGAALPPLSLRSRGQLCLDLLTHDSAAKAAAALEADKHRYNPFTVMFADQSNAFAAYNNGHKIETRRLDAGLHVFSSAAESDTRSFKADRAQIRFAKTSTDQGTGGPPASWVAPLKKVLSDHTIENDAQDPGDAICVHRRDSGTVSSSIVALAAAACRFEMFHCPGPPCENEFRGALVLDLQ